MSHVALYRKYRPDSFSSCIGHEAIKTTLANQIKLGKVGHAYLFTGSRGTGKTTFARIFAKTINCVDLVDGNACLKCAPCVALNEPTNLDILEIDAASNNGVDEIRELRERVKYLPTAGRYKVYIIDEVHMLSLSAFNALLKTLEEPPVHVVFILATTEVHKLPATILSRCMRFDFKLVPQRELIELLGDVLKREKITAEIAALGSIARAAAGSFRDALSILDMCLHYAGKKLTNDIVLKILGSPDIERIAQIVEAIIAGDIVNSINNLDSLVSGGKTVSLIAKDIASFSRDVLCIKTGLDSLVLVSRDDSELMEKVAESATASTLIYLIDEFSRIDSELKYAINPRMLLEATVLKAAMLSDENSVLGLIAKVDKLEAALNVISAGGRVPPLQGATGFNNTGNENVGAALCRPQETFSQENFSLAPPPLPEPPPIALPVQKIETIAKAAIAEDAKSIWGRLITNSRRKQNMQLFALLSEHTNFSLRGRDLVIVADSNTYLKFADEKIITQIKQALAEIEAPIAEVIIEKEVSAINVDADLEELERVTGIKPKVVRK